MRLVANL